MAKLLRPRNLVLLVVVAAIVAGLVVWRVAGSSDPVTRDEALATFRAAPKGAIPAGGPAVGVYLYAATGSERGGAGPLSVTRRIPAQARLVVTPLGAGWEAELSYSRQHVEGARYEVRGGEVRITSRRTKVTFARLGRDDRRTVEPPSLFLPRRLGAGVRWRETYRTGDLTVRADTRIERSERATVGGKPVEVFVISSRSETEGPHPGTRVETLWWAPSLGLPVRWDIDTDIGGVFAFRARTSVRLLSAVPEV